MVHWPKYNDNNHKKETKQSQFKIKIQNKIMFNRTA